MYFTGKPYICPVMKKLLLLLFCLPILAQAQNFPKPDYPRDYFEKPVHIPILLAGNYGELRPGHFHEGLDIKTRGTIGYRVYAAADGYISRVAVSHTGFGHVIYITHPNGYTTVYGHLHEFNQKLEAYVKRQQYKQEHWKIDLSLSPELFPVKQGQFIALSGATGSVAGPHVHFEIRNTKTEHPLNGQLFGFEIKDNIPPRVYRVALYDMNRSIYEQTPKILTLHAKNGHYSPSANIINLSTNKVGFGLQTLDKQNNTSNIYGIYRGILYADKVAQCGFQIDNVGYEETRYVDAHYDYKTYIKTRRHFELFFDLPGNKLPLYYDFAGNGTVDLSDGKIHAIKLVVKDAAGNATAVEFNVRQSAKATATQKKDCDNRMVPDSRNIFENEHVQFFLKPGSLYDEICFQYNEKPAPATGYFSNIYQLHYPYVPLYKSFALRIKPDRPIPEALKDKLIFVCKDEKGDVEGYTPALIKNGWAEAIVRSFGAYAIQTDTTPPELAALNIHEGSDLSHAKNIRFKIGDDKSGIHTYRAELDGKWLMFARKRNTIFYTFDNHCPPGNHILKMTLTDGVGNQTIKIYHFKR